MSSRRKFIYQGSIASLALMTFNPLESVARSLVAATALSDPDKIVFLHTGDHRSDWTSTVRGLSLVNRSSRNVLLFHAGPLSAVRATGLNYDAGLPDAAASSSREESYSLICKHNKRIGVIHAGNVGKNPVPNILAISAWLKQEKKCHLVVCLSQLGYKNKNGIDELNLARASSHLDLILSGHPENTYHQPVIVRNQHQEEVIIHSSAGLFSDFGHIEFSFDKSGKKKSVAIHNLASQPGSAARV